MPHDLIRRRRTGGHGSLAPTLGSRLGRLARPDWTRTDSARRVVAGCLVVAAVVVLLADRRDDAGEPLLVAAHDLTAGHLLSADDVTIVDRPVTDTPAGSTRELDAVVGRTLSSPIRAGEILTDVRVLGPRLAAAATGANDARIVPVRLSDSGVAELIREGDRVDVLTVGPVHDATSRAPAATVLATDATVVLVAPEPATGRRDRVVMLALPSAEASAVAAASLTDSITVTLH